MPRELIVNNLVFQYPVAGDAPGWGGDATLWAVEITNVLADLLGPDDILETSFSVANNQVAVADVTGLVFNTASARSAVVQYAVYRISDTNPSGKAETGELRIVYDNNVGWLIGQGNVIGNSGLNFSITAAGQVQYTSTDIGSLNYVGVMKFTAKVLQQ